MAAQRGAPSRELGSAAGEPSTSLLFSVPPQPDHGSNALPAVLISLAAGLSSVAPAPAGYSALDGTAGAKRVGCGVQVAASSG